ncbi:MAG: hypothetical protein NC307_01490 [Roseburia sp.]|nr:hypothetical protein [Roseburia sp.]
MKWQTQCTSSIFCTASRKCLAELRKKLVKSLICMKTFYRGRLLGQYWRIILDGTVFYEEEYPVFCL